MFSSFILAMMIAGVVHDTTGHPVSAATVRVGAASTQTSADGRFALDVPDGTYEVTISHPGFTTGSVWVRASARTHTEAADVDITLTPRLAESIIVSGIRAEAKTPVTKSDLDRHDIEKSYYQQDIPLLLRDTPSINAWAESGVGDSGYSYISLRGISPTRINFTLDGVPLADSEDMGTYFVDFPDLAQSLQSIQIQRGVGTSTVGTPSFGGSVNLESIDLAHDSSTTARVAAGSFDSRFATVGFQSGSLPGGFAMYTRISANDTNGFREHSGTEQRNIFVSAAKQGQSSQLRLTGFTGHEQQHLSFYAADADTLATNLRANPLRPEERDSFGYDLANLQYLKSLESGASLTASAFYQRGYGWYRLYDDSASRTDLRQYGLDGMLIGSMLTYSQTRGSLTTNYGVHINRFRREHTRDLVAGGRDYYNYGVKDEANAFAKASIDRSAWHFYGDTQLRYTDFAYHGQVHIDPIHWIFLNPKLGVRRELSSAASVYASAGVSTREPTRNDMFQGEDDASFAHDLHAVKPERLFDFESGVDYRAAAVTLKANVYAMQFRNEIASTGELSDIGLLLRRNVDRSYRRGIEVDAAFDVTSALRLRTVASLSRNRIGTWTQFYDVYDADGNFVDSKPVAYHNVEPVLTPSVIVSEAVELTPSSRFSAGAVARYVGRSFLDNTDNRDFITPHFFSIDGSASLALSRWSRLSVQLNNVLNNKRLFANGYSYVYLSRQRGGEETLTGTSYYFPQATRNVVVMLDFKL